MERTHSVRSVRAATDARGGTARHSGVMATVALLASLCGCAELAPGPAIEIWAVGAERDIYRDPAPRPESDLYSAARREIRLRGAIGEVVAVQLALRGTDSPDRRIDLRIGDFSGPGGTIAAADVAALHRVQPVRVESFRSWYPAHTGLSATPVLIGDVLIPWSAAPAGGPLVLSGAQPQAAWLDLRIPPATSPGEYAARIEIRDAGAPRAAPIETLSLRLLVLPLALPSEGSLPLIGTVDPRGLGGPNSGWERVRAEDARLIFDSAAHAPAIRIVDSAITMLHEHRVAPILWAGFPKYRPVAEAGIELDWAPYDALAGRWLDGTLFSDRRPLPAWALPLSTRYPDAATNGGLASAAYARLLADYYLDCRRHFAERRWPARRWVRPTAPMALSGDSVATALRAAEILRRADADAPLLLHLPARSPRSLGWFQAPSVDPPPSAALAPPAALYEPEAMAARQARGAASWFMPDHPPFSPSLRVEAPATDPRAIGWLAFRYGADGVWIEGAADATRIQPGAPPTVDGAALVYPGDAFGLPGRVLPSARLKRLRAGLQDHALLQLLDGAGKGLLARTTARRMVRHGFTDACLDDPMTVLESGWPAAPGAYELARELLLQELLNEYVPSESGSARQVAILSGWGRLMQNGAPVEVRSGGVRLTSGGDMVRAEVFVHAANRTDRPIAGAWSVSAPPIGWRAPPPLAVTLPPDGRRRATLELELQSAAYSLDGVFQFAARFDSDAIGAFDVPCRLALAAAPFTDVTPRIDGDLSDWALMPSNTAGDFRLCRGDGPDGSGRPTLPTQAFFAVDDRALYVAVRCAVPTGAPLRWVADNDVPVDGAIPWGQDVVEVLLSPTNVTQGGSGDVRVIQIKPSGLLTARIGCRTDPPIGPSEEWRCDARVAVRMDAGAWTVELALPLASVGSPAAGAAPRSRIWGVNVTRLDSTRGEYSSWSGARGHCYSPAALGNLLMGWR
ncbi:MAG: hypothetical protein HRU75_04315 [Planctomycetia bacterium]|nr:MAG: hypothetical protein HRU75_04315 [Planctomycetia bacterium]